MTEDRNNTAQLDQDFEEDELIIRKKKAPEVKTGVTAASILKTAAEAFAALKAKRPLVQCMMSTVSTNLAANALLALGAVPVMVEDLGEASQLADQTDGLLVNTGLVSKPQTDAMRAAVSHANMGGHPWLFDPVRVGQLPLRTFLAKELIRRFPSILRGKPTEIAFLAGNEGAWKSAEPLTAEAVAPQAVRLASAIRSAVILSGKTADFVAVEGAPLVAVEHENPYLDLVAGFGCTQGAIGAAFLGTMGGKGRWEAALAATVVTAIVATQAAAKAKGPAAFQAAFVDALAALTPADVLKLGKVKVAG